MILGGWGVVGLVPSPDLRFVWVIIDVARNDGRHGRGTVTGWQTKRVPANSEGSNTSEHPAGAGDQVPAAWLARAAALCRERVLPRHPVARTLFGQRGGVGGAWSWLERPYGFSERCMMLGQVRWGSHGPGGASLGVVFTSRFAFPRCSTVAPMIPWSDRMWSNPVLSERGGCLSPCFHERAICSRTDALAG